MSFFRLNFFLGKLQKNFLLQAGKTPKRIMLAADVGQRPRTNPLRRLSNVSANTKRDARAPTQPKNKDVLVYFADNGRAVVDRTDDICKTDGVPTDELARYRRGTEVDSPESRCEWAAVGDGSWQSETAQRLIRMARPMPVPWSAIRIVGDSLLPRPPF